MLKYTTVNYMVILLLLLLMVFDRIFDLPFFLYVFVVVVYLTLLIYGTFVMSAQFFLTAFCNSETSSGSIAITFDDGPIPGKTEKILEILNTYKVPAAFFCIGFRIADHPALAKQIHEAGHLLGNHSYWHKNTFELQSAGRIETELLKTDTAIHHAIGLNPNFFRPPHGVTNPMVAKAILRRGYQTIGWSVRSFDTISDDRTTLLKRVTRSLKGGDIVLFHDNCSITLEILPEFLDRVSALGLKIIRVDDLLGKKAYG